jgi:hypothetical protein
LPVHTLKNARPVPRRVAYRLLQNERRREAFGNFKGAVGLAPQRPLPSPPSPPAPAALGGSLLTSDFIRLPHDKLSSADGLSAHHPIETRSEPCFA